MKTTLSTVMLLAATTLALTGCGAQGFSSNSKNTADATNAANLQSMTDAQLEASSIFASAERAALTGDTSEATTEPASEPTPQPAPELAVCPTLPSQLITHLMALDPTIKTHIITHLNQAHLRLTELHLRFEQMDVSGMGPEAAARKARLLQHIDARLKRLACMIDQLSAIATPI